MKLLFCREEKPCGGKKRKKKGLEEYKDEVNILDRIEEVREKLHDMINQKMTSNNEVVKLSQCLDKLIVQYVKGSGKDSNDERKQKYFY